MQELEFYETRKNRETDRRAAAVVLVTRGAVQKTKEKPHNPMPDGGGRGNSRNDSKQSKINNTATTSSILSPPPPPNFT